jgi:TM2 domain-containing membrane protein YozV
MHRLSTVFTILSVILISSLHASEKINISTPIDSAYACDSVLFLDISVEQKKIHNDDSLRLITTSPATKPKFKAKKIIAAVLAFPVPFGLLGLHRIFLGTKPYIPFVYIGSVGGCFLILPAIDFINILSADEKTLNGFANNSKVFIWAH